MRPEIELEIRRIMTDLDKTEDDQDSMIANIKSAERSLKDRKSGSEFVESVHSCQRMISGSLEDGRYMIAHVTSVLFIMGEKSSGKEWHYGFDMIRGYPATTPESSLQEEEQTDPVLHGPR